MEHETDAGIHKTLIGETASQFPHDYDTTLNGLGGWMVMVIIGRFATIILSIYNIIDAAPLFGLVPELDTWIIILFTESILFDILLSGVILFFIFKRNIVFRKLLVFQAAIFFAFVIISSAAYDTLMFDSTDIIRSIVSSIIWISYLYKSKRVRNTFIYAHQAFPSPSQAFADDI